jgi:DUF4097 and DUF4098 domain-containing protein YvlB
MLVYSIALTRDMKKDYHETFEVKSGDILYLSHGDGNVTISSWDKDIVDIEIYFSANIFGMGNDEYEFDVQFQQHGNEIEVIEKFKNNHHFGIKGITIDRYEYQIRAPKYLQLNLNGDDGDVEIEDMAANIECRLSDGDMEINNVVAKLIKLNLEDGSLKMKDIEAELDLKIDDGDIRIVDYSGKECTVDLEDGQLEMDNASGNFDISSDDGDMELRHLTVGTLKASSNDGDIYIDIVESDAPDIEIKVDDAKVIVDINENISAKIEIETDDGSINTNISNPEYEKKKPSFYFGEIHGGKGRIYIRTNDGDVVLRETN